MIIDPNKRYRTRDGRAVRIYATDGGYAGNEIHGAVHDDAKWHPAIWDSEGNFIDSFNHYPVGRGHNEDLTEVTLADELRDQIPWSALRPEFRWVAFEPSGINGVGGFWLYCKSKPQALSQGWECSKYIAHETVIDTVITMPRVDPARWRETLIERPEDT